MSKRSSKSTRKLACTLAARVMAGRPTEPCAPTLWSLAVFFESYIERGAAGTRKDFGPKKPRKLRIVR